MSNGINSPYGLIAVESISGSGATRKMKNYKVAVNTDGTVNSNIPIFYGDPVKFKPVTGPNDFSSSGSSIMGTFTPVANQSATVTPGRILGTFISCTYTDAASGRFMERNYWPGASVVKGTNVTFYINDDPDVIFRVQMSTSTDNNTTLVNNQPQSIYQDWMVGLNAILQVGGVPFAGPNSTGTNPLLIPANNPPTGNTVSGRSAVYLDGSTINMSKDGTAPGNGGATIPGNASFDVKIIGLAPVNGPVNTPPLAAASYNTLVPGTNMPFCDVLVKFNYHVFFPGTSGPYSLS